MIELCTETVNCGICRSSESTELFVERYSLGGSAADLGIRRCRQCDVVYVSPRLTVDSTDFVYRFDAEHTISHNYCWDGSTNAKRFAPLLRRLKELAPAGRLLDVGCGGGHFLAAAKSTGSWEPIGVEPVPSAAKAAREYSQCTIHSSTLQDADLPNHSFQIVTLLGVLEHLHDPVSTLKVARKLLAPDGVLAVYVPNFNYLRWKDTGLAARVRTGRSSKLHPQEHLFQYTPRTLARLLATSGFALTRTDIGRPFIHGYVAKRMLKEFAYMAVRALYASTGIHLGGIEAIASPVDTHQFREGNLAQREAA